MTLLVILCSPVCNEDAFYFVDMEGSPVEECPRGCFLVKEQIKTCQTDVSISESSHAESDNSHERTMWHDNISPISTHEWLLGVKKTAEVTAQILYLWQSKFVSRKNAEPTVF